MSNAVGWAQFAATAGVGGAGLWLVHSIDRRRRAEIQLTVAQRRFDAYTRLWSITAAAAPMDRLVDRTPLSSEADRRTLFDLLTEWYFGDGNGMLLGEPARTIYLSAKENLVLPTDRLPPLARRSVEGDVDPRLARGRLSMRQLSLLRTAMRSDLAVFGSIFGEPLDPVDVEFLRACHVDVTKRPWSVAKHGQAPKPGQGGPAMDDQPSTDAGSRSIWQDHMRSQEFEHELINRKTTWLLTTQGLLFAAYGVAFGETQPGERLKEFQSLVAWTGLLSSAVLLVGVVALIVSKWVSWRRYGAYFKVAGGLPAPHDPRRLQWGVHTVNTFFALAPDVALPVVFGSVWVQLL